MSGIFKGDSIYKSGGGGGGGYKDGGQLVDGDFIKVENNTVSSYDNVSRDTLNFYIEVKDGEVLNTVIELTNEYNATVHVYIVQNGLFIPLGNVGGDTVNAGVDYNLTVIGNSFIIDTVTPSSNTPNYAEFNGKIYKLLNNTGTTFLVQPDGPLAGKYWNRTQANAISAGTDWRLADDTEWTKFINIATSDDVKKYGYFSPSSGVLNYGSEADIWGSGGGGTYSFYYSYPGWGGSYPQPGAGCGVLLVLK